jgi:hypothetical protein
LASHLAKLELAEKHFLIDINQMEHEEQMVFLDEIKKLYLLEQN